MYYVADKIGTVENFIGGLKSQLFFFIISSIKQIISPHRKYFRRKNLLNLIQTHCVQKTEKIFFLIPNFFILKISFVRFFFNNMEKFVS